MMCVWLLTLTGIGGMGVDFGNFYVHAGRYQQAADAAALAAAPFLPGDPAAADAAARKVLAANGISLDHVSTTQRVATQLEAKGADRFEDHVYLAPDAKFKNRMRVDVGSTLNTYFVSLLGYNEQALTRSSLGAYRANIPMGSPSPVLGAEAPSAEGDLASVNDKGFNGKYWLNISGGATDKVMGDRYTAGRCSTGTDNCSGTGQNLSYPYGDDNGRSHQYVVHVPKKTAAGVSVQVFDGAFVDEGDYCNSNGSLGSAAMKALAPSYDKTRYDAGPSNVNCTGDYIQTSAQNLPLPTMTVKIHKPTAKKDQLGDVIRTVHFDGLRANANLVDAVKAGSSEDSNNPSIAESFRQWFTVGELTEPGDYVVEITTPTNAHGANRYSLRAGVLGANDKWSPSQSDGVSVYARGHLTVFTNAKANDTSFYFAKLTSGSAGRTVKFNLYDIGDVTGGQAVDLQLVPPANSNITTSGFSNCSQTGPGTMSVGSLPNCTIVGATPAKYNGKNVVLSVQVPDNYVCNDKGGSGCWMALRFVVTGNVGAQQPSQDTTTWEVVECGRPVQLINEDYTTPVGSTCSIDN